MTYADFERRYVAEPRNGATVPPVLTLGCADGAHATCPRWDYASDRDVAPIDACGCLCHNATHGDRAEYFRECGDALAAWSARREDHVRYAKLTPRSVARQHVYHAWEDAEHYASLGCASCYRVVGLGES